MRYGTMDQMEKSHETRQSALAATSTWSRWCHEADAQASVPAPAGLLDLGTAFVPTSGRSVR